MTWNTLINEVRTKKLKSASWESDQRHLQEILEKAQEWGIPETYSQITISGLRTITNEARRAVKMNDPDRLEQLLMWAAELTVVDLRLKLGTPMLELIEVTAHGEGATRSYQVILTQEQFDLVKQKTRLNLKFKVTGNR